MLLPSMEKIDPTFYDSEVAVLCGPWTDAQSQENCGVSDTTGILQLPAQYTNNRSKKLVAAVT